MKSKVVKFFEDKFFLNETVKEFEDSKAFTEIKVSPVQKYFKLEGFSKLTEYQMKFKFPDAVSI